MAGHHKLRHHHRASGGRMEYTKDSNVQREAKAHSDSFKHGGRKHKHHGHVHGHHAKKRADRHARGGKVGSHSPFSHAAEGIDKGRTTHNVAKDSLMGGGHGHGLKHGGHAHHHKKGHH